MAAPLSPMLATLGNLDSLTAGVTWRLEGKWDGVRAVASIGVASIGDTSIGDGSLILRSRTDREMTAAFPELGELPELLAGRAAALDGEIVAFGPHGQTSFGLLQQRIGLTRPVDVQRVRQAVPVAYLIFDVLSLDGELLLDKPYDERRAILQGLGIAGEFCSVPGQLHGEPAEVLARTKADGWEGMIAKKSDSRYSPGKRSPAWIKVKNEKDIEVAVIGWEPGQGRRDGMIGSLILAVPAGAGWRYVGKVGTGFTDKILVDLAARLAPLHADSSPVTETLPPGADLRQARWVQPELVGEVVYSEVTRHGTFRHPRWRGLRVDKRLTDLKPLPAE
jgi:bifunctional non-homologous end joining protein LigD